MHIDGRGGHEAVFVHQADASIFGYAPYTCMSCDGQIEIPRNLERAFFREIRIASDIEGDLHAQHISAPIDTALNEVGKLGSLCPLPGSAQQVAIRENEPARHRLKRIDCRVCILNRLQTVRPVNGCGDSSVYSLDCGEQVSGVNIFTPEDIAPVQVVELKIVCEGPVGSIAAQRCLPHMAVCVNHPWHENTTGCVNLHRAIRRCQLASNSRDALVFNEDIAMFDHARRGVNGQHGSVTKYDGAT